MSKFNNELAQIFDKINKKKLHEAYVDLKELIKTSPLNHIAYNLLAQIEIENKNLNNAMLFIDKGLGIQPNSIELLFNKATIFNLNNDHGQAEKILKDILLINRNIFQVYISLAGTQKKLMKFDDAISNYNEAIKINKNFFQAYYNIANIYLIKKNFDLAIDNFSKSLNLNPNHEGSMINLGQCYYYKKNFKKALELYNRTLELNPNNYLAKYNKSLTSFKVGNFKEAWDLYESRWFIKDQSFISFKSIKEKYKKNMDISNLYVWPEQGLGDEIMFSSIFNDFKNLKIKVSASCDSRLLDIFKASFPHINFFSNNLIINQDTFDSHISYGSLFKFFRNTPDNFNGSSYLLPTINQGIEKNISNLNKNKKKIIGISWKSSNKDFGQYRSIKLKDIFSKINFEDNLIVNLQYGDVDSEVNSIEKIFGYKIYTLCDNFNNINDLSCVINLCDYVITIDNSIVHLSGALGKKTYLLLPFYSDWRWMENSEKTYWYDSVQVFQQTTSMNWLDILEKLSSVIK